MQRDLFPCIGCSLFSLFPNIFSRNESISFCPISLSFSAASSLNSLLDFLPCLLWRSKERRDSLERFLVRILSKVRGVGLRGRVGVEETKRVGKREEGPKGGGDMKKDQQ